MISFSWYVCCDRIWALPGRILLPGWCGPFACTKWNIRRCWRFQSDQLFAGVVWTDSWTQRLSGLSHWVLLCGQWCHFRHTMCAGLLEWPTRPNNVPGVQPRCILPVGGVLTATLYTWVILRGQCRSANTVSSGIFWGESI